MINEIRLTFKENKKAIIAATTILFISLILGYILKPYLYDILNPVVEDLTKKVHTGVIKLTFQDIFLNNIKIVFLMFFFGLVCCFSAIILAYNGFFTGYYVATTNNLTHTLLLTIPHGIFEFPSCILACASGFVLFNFLVKFLKTLLKQKNTSIKESLTVAFNISYIKLKQAIILLIFASILMIIAGFVEVYLTVPISQFVISIFG